jgi:outer membrane protein
MYFRTNCRLLTLSFVFLFFVSSSYAQKNWTLQECVDYALKNNITVKQTEISSQLSKDAVLQSYGNMLPSLNGSGSHSYNYGRSVDPYSYTFTTSAVQSTNLSLNSSLTLFNGLELQNTLKRSKLDYMAGKYDVDKIKNDIALNVAADYLQILYSKENQKAANDRVEAAAKQRDRTKALVDAGTFAKGNLLDAEAQLAAEELNKVTADNNLISSKLNLVQLLQLDSVSTIEIEDPAIAIPDQSSLTLTPESIFEAAIKTLPEIKSADTKNQSAEKSLSISRGGRFPRLSLFGSLSTGYSNQSKRYTSLPVFLGYGQSGYITSSGEDVLQPLYSYHLENTPFKDQINNNYNKSFGLSINIPLFNGFSVYSNVKRAKLNLENSKLTAQQTRNNVYKSIQQAHAEAQAALNRYNASEKSVSAMQEAFTYTEKKFNAGMLNSVEFVTAKNNLSKAQSDLLQSKYDFILKLKVLDFYLGKPLSF